VTRSAAQKMGVKGGARTYFVNAPASVIATIQLPALDIGETLHGVFGYIHLFAKSQAEMDSVFPNLKTHLQERGMLWVSWPKGGKLGADLTLPHVIRIGYGHGMVESTTISLDETWSAIKFTYPKPGKIYNNSYGALPS